MPADDGLIKSALAVPTINDDAGGGGEYGEEWGRMHKRVKRGFEKTVEDYIYGDAGLKITSGSSSPTRWRNATSFDQLKKSAERRNDDKVVTDNVSNLSIDESANTDADTILIFIAHGAPCNALIGAMTNQPVLMDIGIASLTLGVLQAPHSLPPTKSSHDATDQASIPTYSIKLSASTDHLRTSSVITSPSIAPSNGSPSVRPVRKAAPGGFSLYNKYPTIATSSPAHPPTRRAMASVFGNNRSSVSDNKGSSNEDNSTGTGVRRSASAASSSRGLWSRQELPLPSVVASSNGGHSSDEGAVLTDEDESISVQKPKLKPRTMSGVELWKKKDDNTGSGTNISGNVGKTPAEPVRGTGLFQVKEKTTNTSTVPSIGLFQSSKPQSQAQVQAQQPIQSPSKSQDLAASTAAVPSGSTGLFKSQSTTSNSASSTIPTTSTTVVVNRDGSNIGGNDKNSTTSANNNAHFGLWGANNHFVPGSGLGSDNTNAEVDGVERKRRWTVDQGTGR